MTKRYALCLVAFIVALTAIAPEANAQVSRLYLAGYMGLNVFRDLEFKESSADLSGEIQPEHGTSFAGALGLRLSENLRAEAEIMYGQTNFETLNLSTGSSSGIDGEISNWTGLLNVYYDFDVPWTVQPFIGGGIGYGFFDSDIQNSSGLAPNTVDDASTFVWQIGGGLKYRMAPDLALTGSYRYINSLDLEIGTYDIDYNNHEFRIGLEYDLPYE